MASAENGILAVVAILAGLFSGGLIIALMPWLKAYALARPNARSSHREPTPQGGGIAVIVATLLAAWLGVSLAGMAALGDVLALTVAALALAATGAVDDIRPLPVRLRLALQCAAVGLVLAFIPAESRIIPELPWWLERAGLLLGGIWFVNLTNFMDGIDWMTIAEAVPIAGAIILLGLLGFLGVVPTSPLMVAVALFGAMIGFAPFNKPVARLFLGDVGSLPIGLLLAWLLFHVAASGHLAAAILLPLYYLADTALTLLRRALAREPVWQAHRSHFYQRATDGGFSVNAIVLRVFLVNLALGALAIITVVRPHGSVSAAALGVGAAMVGMLLESFARGRKA
jgi:UDP-N-acetylmuramyl pentapeptide phosphotransferase/UDP-N-acetylglucosamine-1-phosphate transferase